MTTTARRWLRRRETTVGNASTSESGVTVRLPSVRNVSPWLIAIVLSGAGVGTGTVYGRAVTEAQVESQAAQIARLDERLKNAEARLERMESKIDRLLERSHP